MDMEIYIIYILPITKLQHGIYLAICLNNINNKQHIYIYIYIYLETVCPLFWGLNPPKEGPFHSKQGLFLGSRSISHKYP